LPKVDEDVELEIIEDDTLKTFLDGLAQGLLSPTRAGDELRAIDDGRQGPGLARVRGSRVGPARSDMVPCLGSESGMPNVDAPLLDMWKGMRTRDGLLMGFKEEKRMNE